MTKPKPNPHHLRLAFDVLDAHGITSHRHMVSRSRQTLAEWMAEAIAAYAAGQTVVDARRILEAHNARGAFWTRDDIENEIFDAMNSGEIYVETTERVNEIVAATMESSDWWALDDADNHSFDRIRDAYRAQLTEGERSGEPPC